MDDLRKKIDAIDDEMLELFLKRMQIVKQIAEEKKRKGLAIYNPDRESEVLSRLTNKIDDEILSGLYPKFIVNVMDLAKLYQELINKE